MPRHPMFNPGLLVAATEAPGHFGLLRLLLTMARPGREARDALFFSQFLPSSCAAGLWPERTLPTAGDDASTSSPPQHTAPPADTVSGCAQTVVK